MVSHNIEEAVEMADRILIFSSDPGRISAEIPVALPRPRAPESAPFRQIMDQVYTLLTTVPGRDGRRGAKPEPIGIGYRLPDAVGAAALGADRAADRAALSRPRRPAASRRRGKPRDGRAVPADRDCCSCSAGPMSAAATSS